MKILIVGRSGTGKDTLAKELSKYGLKQLKSFATRPRRTYNEDTHLFVSEEVAEQITDRIAETKINGYTYFATRSQVDQADVYIVDPNGFYQVTRNMPDTTFLVIYLMSDVSQAKEKAINRAEDREREAEVWEKRTSSEKADFDEFEENSGKALVGWPENVIHWERWNDYTAECIQDITKDIVRCKTLWDNTETMLQYAISSNIVTVNQGKIMVYKSDENGNCLPTPHPYSTDNFIRILLNERDHEGFWRVAYQYLAETKLQA